MTAHRTRSKAFTLVEILIVVVILGILSTIAFTVFGNVAHDARVARAQTDLRAIQSRIDVWSTENGGDYPTQITLAMLEDWFGNVRPHPFAFPTTPLGVETDGSNDPTIEHPASKTMAGTDFGWWYNPASCSVRSRVPDSGDPAGVLNLYRTVNVSNIVNLAQVD